MPWWWDWQMFWSLLISVQVVVLTWWVGGLIGASGRGTPNSGNKASQERKLSGE